MRRWLPFVVATITIAVFVAPTSIPSRAGQHDWLETIRTKSWATAFLDTSAAEGRFAPADLVIASVGGVERIIYRATVMDRVFGWPVVSPDGSRVALFKDDGRRAHIVAMNIDGSDFRVVLALRQLGESIKGTRTSSPVAWSHDNRWLLLIGRLESEEPPRPQAGGPPQSLWRVDMTTGNITRLRHVELRKFREGFAGTDITAQAWAPDGRRLVFSNADFHAVIYDTVTGTETDIGPGQDPTWSPDGRFIAVQLPKHDSPPGDYFLIDTQPPYRRTLLVSNARTLFSWSGPRYLTDPIWLPDSDGVFLYQFRRPEGTPYIVRRTTGEATKMPFRYMSHSWGGRP